MRPICPSKTISVSVFFTVVISLCVAFVVRSAEARSVKNRAVPSRKDRSLEPMQTPPPAPTNVALASNGGVATASSYFSNPNYGTYLPSYVNDGARKSLNGAIWLDNNQNTFPDWLQIDFNGSKTISEIDVITQQDDTQNPVEPTLTQTFGIWGISAFDAQYWSGSSWVTVTGGSVTGNNKVWRQITFASVTTSKIRVLVNDSVDHIYSRVVEVEAWTAATPPPTTNVALSANGGVATASSYFSNPNYGTYLPSYVNDGARKSLNGAIWLDNNQNTFPDWLQIDFNGSKTISEIDVITQQDDTQNPVEPTLTQTFGIWGISAFDVQYWNGSSWVTVTGGSVTGNNKVWRQITFASVTTSKIRVLVNDSVDHIYSRVVEVEAWTAAAPPPTTNVALASNGGVATASSYFSNPNYGTYLPSYVNDGARKSLNGAIWLDNNQNTFPDWLQIDFNGSKTISEIDVITQQDDTQNPVEPTLTQTFGIWGISAFDVQYWNGSSWVTVTDGSVRDNNKVWRQFSFASVTTSKIRVLVNDSVDHIYSRVVEVEAREEGVENQSPFAAVGGPYSGLSGSYIQLNGSSSHDPDGTVVDYQWNFGDNTTGTGAAPIHAYASAGTYTASLTVTDNQGAITTGNATVTVIPSTDQPPVANPGGPYSPNAGSSVQFTGSGSYDPDGTITTYRWDFGDGSSASVTNPTHTFASPGSHLVSLTVTDNLGASNSKGVDVVVKTSGGLNAESAADVIWDPSNRGSVDDPRNDRGNAANRSTGNNNFQVVAPVLSLPGRGLDLSLNLVHNALVWNKSGNEIFFDIDHDTPAPGWQLGFGKMVAMGTAGAMIIEPDGTRHPFTGSVIDTPYTSPGNPTIHVPTFKGKTTDGSLIEYRCEMGVNRPVGVARYPNGTVVKYSNYSLDFTHGHSYTYPYFISDSNGNSISIKYFQDTSEPRIERIIDSVGRVIAFHYDSQKRLTSISGPGLPDASGNATIRTFVRLHYKIQTLNLSGAFSGLVPRVNNSSFSAIDAIYYPAAGTGYWFGASDSYSSYGMLTKVMEERGMGFVPGSNPDEQGTIVEGTVTRQQVYSYPSSPSGLTAAPTFSNVTESWDGGPNSVTTTFEILDNSAPNERKVTIIHPDQTKTIQKSFSFNNPPAGDPNKFRDGAIKEEQSVDGAGHVLKNTTYDWEPGPDGAPRLLQTNVTDERGQTLITKYSLYGDNNSIGRVTEYDYDGTTAIRTTRNSFTSYTDTDLDLGLDTFYVPFHIIHPRLLNLPQSAKTYAGDDGANKLASAVEVSYDEYAAPLMAYPTDCNGNYDLFSYGETRVHPVPIGILGHSAYWNPSPLPTQPNCDGGSGSGYVTRRGNATTIKTYADTSNPDAPASPIIETRTYDMTGNVIAKSKNCCEKTSSAFELAAQYAFPASQTRGAADPNSLIRVTTKATYVLATGLPSAKTDANGRQITFSYFSDSLRPREINLSTGARITFDYDDAAMKVTSATRLSANGTITDKSIKTINGLGQVVEEQSLVSSGVNGGSDVWDFVDTSYDQLGRLYRQSRPYRIGDLKQWKETIYDDAGRVSELREPYANGEDLILNGTITRYFYNESTRPQGASSAPGQTTKIVDPWGRWRWSRADSSGQLAEVVEPIPAASDPSVFAATKYSYDAVGNLIKVEQGSQVRRFAYDSLGRLTRQKLAEAAATLNAAGERATTEPEDQRWSEVFAYDDHSNLISRTDARGVRTNYSYQTASVDDPLNRLQSISYDLSRVDTASLTVLPAPPVSYQYRTKTSSSQLRDITQLEQVITGATGSLISTEFFAYDDEGRPFEKRFTFGGRDKPMTLTYGYDSLSRITGTTYPEQYHDNVQNPVRKVVTTSYDESSRETGLKVNNVDYASQVSFNPSSQITSLLIGTGSNQLSEIYQFDPKSGLLTNQSLQRSGTTLKSLAYSYRKDAPCPPGDICTDLYHSTAYTGQVTAVFEDSKYNSYSYDALGRLQHVEQWGGKTNAVLAWTQDYSYDRYGNRTGTTSSGNSGGSAVPLDGFQSLGYDNATNRIVSSGFSYDPAGNQLTNASGQSLTYDAAGRLVRVKGQDNLTVATYTYGSSNQRLITQTGVENSTAKTYYVWDGSSVLAEYTEPTSANMPQWSRNYMYLGARLLATEERTGSGGEVVRYHHPDRLGTRVVTNNADMTYFEQVTLPFGTALDAESTGATRVFVKCCVRAKHQAAIL